MTTSTTEHALNDLLQGELAATETYQQALAKVGNEPGSDELRRIHEEHREAANTLRKHVHGHGGKPSQGSGAWGAFAKTVEGAAKLFGNTAALKALKEGEESGLNTYQKAMSDDRLDPDCKQLVQSVLLPQTKAHVLTLDRLMA
jgi:uncharacterized protein (TIGR02284 family)